MRRSRPRPNKAKGYQNIEDTEAADYTAKRGMEYQGRERRKVIKKVVLFPEGRPWEIEQQGPQFETEYDHQRTNNPVHG
jgi:hypothetical protein